MYGLLGMDTWPKIAVWMDQEDETCDVWSAWSVTDVNQQLNRSWTEVDRREWPISRSRMAWSGPA